ncbi:FAD-dependent oxidoreductase, partial [Streptomyces montanisoli]
MEARADVVVLGAGVAGLAAAHHLAAAGLTVTVLEAAPHVGGRMATDRIDGFLLDRLGPPLSTAYPELRRAPGLGGVGLDALPLRMFAPGFAVHSGGRRYRTGQAVGPALGARSAPRARGARSRSEEHAFQPQAPKLPVCRIPLYSRRGGRGGGGRGGG